MPCRRQIFYPWQKENLFFKSQYLTKHSHNLIPKSILQTPYTLIYQASPRSICISGTFKIFLQEECEIRWDFDFPAKKLVSIFPPKEVSRKDLEYPIFGRKKLHALRLRQVSSAKSEEIASIIEDIFPARFPPGDRKPIVTPFSSASPCAPVYGNICLRFSLSG